PARRRGAAGDAELCVDVLDVVLGSARRNEELRRNLAVRLAVGEETQHLDLAPTQTSRPRSARPRVRISARDVDLLARVHRGVAEVEVRPRRHEIVGACLAELAGDTIAEVAELGHVMNADRKSTRLNSSH